MIFITHVRLAGGSNHEHIVAVKWHSPLATDKKMGECATKTMVDWIEKESKKVFVTDGKSVVPVLVIDHKYLRTKANDKWTDNLLSLPRF
jgi:hypothetical protein